MYSFVHDGGLYLSLIFHIWGKATGPTVSLVMVTLSAVLYKIDRRSKGYQLKFVAATSPWVLPTRCQEDQCSCGMDLFLS